jgi:hypothetical protein
MSALKAGAWPWFGLGLILSAVGLLVLDGAAGAIVLAVGLLAIFGAGVRAISSDVPAHRTTVAFPLVATRRGHATGALGSE